MCFNTLIQAWYSAFNLVQTLYFTFYVFQYLNSSLIFGLQSCTNIVFYFLCVSILESKLDIRPSILLYKHCILLFMCFNTWIQAWYSAFNLVVQILYFTFYVFQYFNPSLIFGLQSCTNIVFYFVLPYVFFILPYVFFILPYVFLFCPMFFLFLKIYCKDMYIIYILLQTMNMDTLSLDFIDLPTKCASLSDDDKLNWCFWWFC